MWKCLAGMSDKHTNKGACKNPFPTCYPESFFLRRFCLLPLLWENVTINAQLCSEKQFYCRLHLGDQSKTNICTIQFWSLMMFAWWIVPQVFALARKKLPVGRTTAIHKMIGSLQNLCTCTLACPNVKEIKLRIPSNTVVFCCLRPLPNSSQICSKEKVSLAVDHGCDHYSEMPYLQTDWKTNVYLPQAGFVEAVPSWHHICSISLNWDQVAENWSSFLPVTLVTVARRYNAISEYMI